MAKPTRGIRFDQNGIRALLNSSEVRAATQAACTAVVENVKSFGITVQGDGTALPVTTKLLSTDRAHGIVSLAHPAGLAVQAKHGVLTKAAAQANLDVRIK